VFDLVLNCLFVSVEGEVVALGGDVGLGYAEALFGSGAVQFVADAFGSSRQRVGEVVLSVVGHVEGHALAVLVSGCRSELVGRE
jgi:hypothetical protein